MRLETKHLTILYESLINNRSIHSERNKTQNKVSARRQQYLMNYLRGNGIRRAKR